MIDVQMFNKALRETDITIVERLVKGCLQQGIPAQTILNDGLIGAMNIVGQEFKAKEIWVPDVLLAARNMHSGITILKPVLLEVQAPTKGTLVIGTVQGDIHDIGKNIVSVLMEGSGFQVIDLGVNVSTEGFLEAIERHKPTIVGLSALLTTTMLEMGKVLSAVRENAGNQAPKLIVGGAPVTQEFADEIGADGYGEDAISGVEVALKLLEK
ncbi:MAG: cobalamin-binding protein [Dehalococcoidia bacterium]|nr:MAG: cobalamin-binding protein [Dehalococcoidia bacterium]